MAKSADIDAQRLSDADRDVLDSVAGSARLEGVEIPRRHRELAAAYMAREMDDPTYRTRAREMIAEDLGLDI